MTIGTTTIPGDTYDVVAGETVETGQAFTRSVTLVGGMDTSNGSATPGQVTTVSDLPDAESKFGTDSELTRASKAALSTAVTDIKAVPVSETQTTENFTAQSSGSLTTANTPIFNPVFHPDHSITVTEDPGGANTDITVNIVYDAANGGSVSQPTDSDTINIDPYTGDWAADASADYDIQYTYGDYSKSATLTPAADEGSRSVIVGQEEEAIITDLGDELGESGGNADDFIFQNGYAAVIPWVNSDTPDTANYSDNLDDKRISINSCPVAYLDEGKTEGVRMQYLIGAYQASVPLGQSTTTDTLPDGAVKTVRTELTPSEAGDLIDEQVLPIINDSGDLEIVKDMTTATEPKFERIYSVEIVDEVTEQSHQINKNFTGGANTEDSRAELRRDHVDFLEDFVNVDPVYLEDYDISVVKDSQNDNQVNVTLGIKPIDVMDFIKTTVVVGDVVQLGGVS